MKMYEVYSMLARGELVDGTKISPHGGESYILTNGEIYHTYYNTPLSAYNNALNKDFMNEEVELILPKVKEIQITIAPIDDLAELREYLEKDGYEVKSIRRVYSYEDDRCLE